jgi:Uncharacterized conserved protein
MKAIGFLGVFFDIKDMINLLSDVVNNRYNETPYRSIIAILFGLGYLICPIDLIPDFFLILGYLDDAVVLRFVVKQFQSDLFLYREWQKVNRI